MTQSWARGLLFLAAGLLAALVGFRSINGPGPELISSRQSEILAMVGGTPITEDIVEADRASDFLNLRRQLHDLRAQALEAAIQAELINLEAGTRGMEPSDLVRLEIFDRVEEPSAEAVGAFFQERRLQGSIEELAPQIKAYLRDQARNTRSTVFLAELEARFSVERWLEPMRMVVASEGFPSKGPDNAPVTIVEFSDFQCSYCRVLLSTLEEVEEIYGSEIRFIFRQFPLTAIHPQAVDAAEASLCANEQGKFWEMHDAMFANQRALRIDQLKATAREVGLDGAPFDDCMDSDRYAEEVMADLEAGQAAGVRGTPMIFINGRALSGAKPLDEITEIIDDELRRAGR